MRAADGTRARQMAPWAVFAAIFVEATAGDTVYAVPGAGIRGTPRGTGWRPRPGAVRMRV